jgi:hypothetical protein
MCDSTQLTASVYFASSGTFGRLSRSPKQPQLNHNNNSSRQSNPSRGFSHNYSGGAGYSVNSSEAQSTATNTYMPSVLASSGPATAPSAVATAAAQQQQQQYAGSNTEVLSPVMRGVSNKAAAAAANGRNGGTAAVTASAALPRLETAYELNSSGSCEDRLGSEHC